MKMYRSLTELIGHTPLLALTGYCRENGLNATIAAKLEAFNPAGSVKEDVYKRQPPGCPACCRSARCSSPRWG